MEAGTFVIFAGDQPWFAGQGTANQDLTLAPIGKGKGVKKPGTKNRASARTDPEPVHPLFLEFARLSADPFWKTTFADAAAGKHHRGFGFSNGVLTYKIRNRLHQCDLNGLTPIEALPRVLEFMRTMGGIMSKQDNEDRTRDLKEALVTAPENAAETWGRVRNEQHRSILITKFVEKLSLEHHLDAKQEDQLENTIRLGLIIKAFDSTTITLEDGLIKEIEGLVFDGQRFRIDPEVIPSPKKPRLRVEVDEPSPEDETPPESGTKVHLLKRWVKFLETIHSQ